MLTFNHYSPTRVVFGGGKLSTVGDYFPNDVKNVLLVSTCSAAERSGAKDLIEVSLNRRGVNLVYFNSVSANPRTFEVDSGAEICKLEDIDAVIAVGGGSAIDAGKAIALCAASRTSSRDLVAGNNGEIPSLFMIAVPTTAGTGSEVSKGAILSDKSRNWKGGLRGDNLFPDVAVLDPTLLKSVPRSIAIETGFDILTHALESLVSRARTPITEIYSKSAITLAVPSVCDLARNSASDTTRENLMLASLLAGFNLANASTCLPHRLQYPIGAKTDSPHARGLAALYPAWFAHTYDFAPEPFNFFGSMIADAVGLTHYKRSKEECLQALNKFLELTELNERLSNFGVTLADCRRFAASVDGNLSVDPGKTDVETIETIYREAL